MVAGLSGYPLGKLYYPVHGGPQQITHNVLTLIHRCRFPCPMPAYYNTPYILTVISLMNLGYAVPPQFFLNLLWNRTLVNKRQFLAHDATLVPSRVSSRQGQLDGSRRLLAQSLPSTYPTLLLKGIWICSEIKVLSKSGTLSQRMELHLVFCFLHHSTSIVAHAVDLV